jgi:hypothetical protein
MLESSPQCQENPARGGTSGSSDGRFKHSPQQESKNKVKEISLQVPGREGVMSWEGITRSHKVGMNNQASVKERERERERERDHWAEEALGLFKFVSKCLRMHFFFSFFGNGV